MIVSRLRRGSSLIFNSAFIDTRGDIRTMVLYQNIIYPSAFSKSLVRIFEAVNRDIPYCGLLHDSVFGG